MAACEALKARGFPGTCSRLCRRMVQGYWTFDRNRDGVVDEFEGVALWEMEVGGRATAAGVRDQEACLRSQWDCPVDDFDEANRGPSLALFLAWEMRGATTCRECAGYYGGGGGPIRGGGS